MKRPQPTREDNQWAARVLVQEYGMRLIDEGGDVVVAVPLTEVSNEFYTMLARLGLDGFRIKLGADGLEIPNG